jgi:hypothetical protein
MEDKDESVRWNSSKNPEGSRFHAQFENISFLRVFVSQKSVLTRALTGPNSGRFHPSRRTFQPEQKQGLRESVP